MDVEGKNQSIVAPAPVAGVVGLRICSIGIAVVALLCNPVLASAQTRVRVVRDGREVRVAHPARLTEKLVALAQSCSLNNVERQPASEESWTRIAGADSFIHVAFVEPRRINLEASSNRGREDRLVSEIILPLPAASRPEAIWVKSTNEIIRLTKYSPIALRQLIAEEDLRLRTVPSYEPLLGMPKQR